MKRVLTTNNEAPVNVECIMNDIDVHGEIKREVFEEEAKDVLDRLVEPVRKVGAGAGARLPACTPGRQSVVVDGWWG